MVREGLQEELLARKSSADGFIREEKKVEIIVNEEGGVFSILSIHFICVEDVLLLRKFRHSSPEIQQQEGCDWRGRIREVSARLRRAR